MTLDAFTPLLAHAGEGASWQALLTVLSAGVAVVLVLILVGKVEVETPGDLVLPLSAVAVLASLAPVAGDPISDAAIYAVPVGAVLLVVLIAVAVRGERPTWRSPLILGGIVTGIVLAIVLSPTLEEAWYPPEARRGAASATDDASAGDAALAVRAGVADEGLRIVVALTDASVGPDEPRPVGDDPTAAGILRLTVDGERVILEPEETCTAARPCDEVTFLLTDLPGGPHEIVAELLRADGSAFEPPLTDEVRVTTR